MSEFVMDIPYCMIPARILGSRESRRRRKQREKNYYSTYRMYVAGRSSNKKRQKRILGEIMAYDQKLGLYEHFFPI